MEELWEQWGKVPQRLFWITTLFHFPCNRKQTQTLYTQTHKEQVPLVPHSLESLFIRESNTAQSPGRKSCLLCLICIVQRHKAISEHFSVDKWDGAYYAFSWDPHRVSAQQWEESASKEAQWCNQERLRSVPVLFKNHMNVLHKKKACCWGPALEP